MTFHQLVYLEEIEEFANAEDYVIAETHVLGQPSPGYSLLTLTHTNLEYVYSFILVANKDSKQLYRCIFKNVITYKI